MEDDVRKLVLGKFYNKCKSKRIPVSNLFLSNRLKELQDEGYLKGCGIKDLISMCEFKPVEKTCLQHVPTSNRNISDKEYKNILKELELEEIEPSDEPLECPICLEEFDDDNIPIERLSPCGHYAHYSCIFKTSKAMGKEPFCPLCNEKVDNVKAPSHSEMLEGRRQLAGQYNRALMGEREGNKQEQFRMYILNKVHITIPFINTSKMIERWNNDNPFNQIQEGEYEEYKNIASNAYNDRFYNQFDPDIDELEVLNTKRTFELIVNYMLIYMSFEEVMKLGPLEIQDMWNKDSIYKVYLIDNIPLYNELNKYILIAENKYKVNKQFNDLYKRLIDFDSQNNTDISSRVKTKYELLRNKEDKKNLIPGTLVEKEIFNKNFDKLTKSGCSIM